MSQNAVVVRPPAQAVALRQFLSSETVTRELAKVMPKGLTPARAVRQTLTLAMKNPELLGCTQTSILGGLIQAAELGLELSGPLGHAYLVPRWNGKAKAKEANFQIGYRGLIELAFRSGKITAFSLRPVYEKDYFNIQYGSYHRIDHTPHRDGDPGPAVGYYAIVFMVVGGSDFEFMSRLQTDAHRAKYASSKGAFSPWETNYDDMSLKTVARRLGKRVPLSVEFTTAVMEDEYNEAGVPAEARDLPPGASRTDALAEVLDAPSGEAAGADPEAEAG